MLVAAAKGETLGNPVWSPDGTTLAYVAGGEDDGQIMLRDVTGATRELTPKRANIADSDPTGRPTARGSSSTRWTADPKADTITTRDRRPRPSPRGAEQVLVKQKMDARLSSVFNPAWSPDGATIAYTLYRYDRQPTARRRSAPCPPPAVPRSS